MTGMGISESFSEHESSAPRAASVVDRLSPRERVVLELATLGLTNVQVAARLGLTIHAVKFHLASIYRKLEVSNRTEAAVMYLRESRTS
jgi:DNA-binding NarL/FixJ family response regulator